jgi:hypothetical protein
VREDLSIPAAWRSKNVSMMVKVRKKARIFIPLETLARDELLESWTKKRRTKV